MNPADAPNRCRIVLIAPGGIDPSRLLSAFEGGDVASLILPAWDMDNDAFQDFAEAVVPAAQAQGAAVMIASGDARVAMRVQADGIHFEGRRAELDELIEKHQSKMMIGTGGATSRDEALDLGEARPDYIFFGRFGYDLKPDPHPRNLKLGQWWSEMVQLPCVVAAGADLDSAADVAATGADFVALSTAVYAEGTDPAEAMRCVNALLDERAPRFGT